MQVTTATTKLRYGARIVRREVTIEVATPADAEGIATLLAQYMRETYGRNSDVTAEVLRRDGMGEWFRMLVASAPETGIVGLLAWERVYDLHHGVHGGHVMDAYVARPFRARGIAPRMLARVADEVRREGGVFIKGQAIDPRPLHLYSRVAMGFPGTDCIVGGRAFRVIADLAGADARTIARSLPPREWNEEP